MANTLAGFIEYAFAKSGAKAEVFDIIACAPPARERYYKRGFDHVELLGKFVSEKLGVPMLQDAIIKVKKNRPQHTLSARKRAANVRGVYKVALPEDIKGKNVLLIDDVFTTGATANEISRMLKKAGAKYVLAATIAKTVPKI